MDRALAFSVLGYGTDPDPSGPDPHGYGWFQLRGRTDRELQAIHHLASIWQIEFHPDGERFRIYPRNDCYWYEC